MISYVATGYIATGYIADEQQGSKIVYPGYASINLSAKNVLIPTRIFPNKTNIAIHPNSAIQRINAGCAIIKISAFTPLLNSSMSIIISANNASFFTSFKFYTGNDEEVIADNSTKVIVSALWLRIKPQYESLTQKAYIMANVQNLKITLNMPKVINRVYADFANISVRTNSSMAQMDQKRFVTKIDNIELDYPMYFDDTEEITHTATKTKAVDDSTVVSILPLGKYSKSVTISGYTFDFDAIRSISFDKEVELVFEDNSTEMARFDLLNNPLSIDEVANNYYDVKMKVLI